MIEKIVHKTWLLDGFFHSAPGFVTIEGNTFSFSLVDTGTFSEKRLNKFESYKGLDASFEKLRNEEIIEIINIDFSQISAKFPWYNFMGGAVLHFEGFNQKMQLSFLQPQNTKFPYHRIDEPVVQLMAANESLGDMKAGRAFGKKLQELLS
jgi:hypothetical protein